MKPAPHRRRQIIIPGMDYAVVLEECEYDGAVPHHMSVDFAYHYNPCTLTQGR